MEMLAVTVLNNSFIFLCFKCAVFFLLNVLKKIKRWNITNMSNTLTFWCFVKHHQRPSLCKHCIVVMILHQTCSKLNPNVSDLLIRLCFSSFPQVCCRGFKRFFFKLNSFSFSLLSFFFCLPSEVFRFVWSRRRRRGFWLIEWTSALAVWLLADYSSELLPKCFWLGSKVRSFL